MPEVLHEGKALYILLLYCNILERYFAIRINIVYHYIHICYSAFHEIKYQEIFVVNPEIFDSNHVEKCKFYMLSGESLKIIMYLIINVRF